MLFVWCLGPPSLDRNPHQAGPVTHTYTLTHTPHKPKRTLKPQKDYPELVNDKGEDGWTPIFRACYNNRLELAQFLAEHGANLGRNADDFENTPLHACCINGHREVHYGGGM